MFRLSAIALLAASVAVAAPVPKGTEAKLYFPTTVGDERVILEKFPGWSMQSTETVTKVEIKDGVTTVALKSLFPNGTKREQDFDVTDDGVFMSFPGIARAAGLRLLKVGGKPGDTWDSEYVGERGERGTRTYTLGNEEVEVPAGKYRAIRVDVAWGSGKDEKKQTQWYAKRVGLVKQVTTIDQRERTILLESFTPGEVKKKDELKKDK